MIFGIHERLVLVAFVPIWANVMVETWMHFFMHNSVRSTWSRFSVKRHQLESTLYDISTIVNE